VTTPQESQDALLSLLLTRLGDTPAATWLTEAAGDVGTARDALLDAARQVGRKSIVASFKERAAARLETADGTLAVGEWRLDEATRTLLLARLATANDQPQQVLFDAYDRGDTETRLAALRALALVPVADPRLGLEMVLDAGRTNDPKLTAAAWCNPFSGKHLSDHDYRKAVLKAFFTGVAVEGFPRLLERADAELAQSLCEFIDERLAAGRTVTPTIWMVAALYPQPGLVARLLGNLEHPNPEERRAAAQALQNARDPRAASFLAERLAREEDPGVREALTQAQAAIEQEGGP
jgi:hypothetical protein